MLSAVRAHPFNPMAQGYHATYREGEANHCPGCGRAHWIVGRRSAECAFCSTAIALADGLNAQEPDPFIFERGRGGGHVR